jgi:tetratricopeptide (TPR) repeat protein
MPNVMAANFSLVRSGFFPIARIISLLHASLICALFAGGFCLRAQQLGTVAIRGAVTDPNGNPVPDVVVSLQQTGVVTRTDAHGDFAFANVRPGKYSVRAEKADMRASAEISTGDAAEQITLILSANAARTGSMEFTDKPNFTVAGITDWTAVGGHGSDASLRTSETLAREAATLRPDAAVAHAHTSDTEGALRAAAAASPESFAANRELGKFCLHERRYREAMLPLEKAFHIDPTNSRNEYDLAFVYKEAGDLKRAHEHIQHLLASENSAEFHRLAGDVEEAMGDALSAEREYETAVHLDPSESNEFTWGTELLLHRAVWPATEVFRRGAASYPKSARMLSALGVALFASARYEEAAQHLCKATGLNPEDPAPYAFLGEIEIASPAPLDCAEQKLARFTQAQPGNARAKYYYAMAILKRQDIPANTADAENALSLLMKAIELDPKFGEAYLQLGILCMNKKDYQQSIDFFTKAVETNPQLGDAHYRLGVVYQRIGSAEKARQEFERHDAIEKAQAEAVEQQRSQVKQFMVVLQGQSTYAK